MAVNSPGVIAEATTEDFIDEGVSNLVYGIANTYWDTGLQKSTDSKKTFKELGQEAFNEAIEGAEQTLRFSIMNAVIMTVSTYAIDKLVLTGGSFYLWIKKRTLLKNLSGKIKDKQYFGRTGSAKISKVLDVLSGQKDEDLKMVGMANDSANNIVTSISQERQTTTMQLSQQRNQLLKTLGLSQNSKGLNDKKKLEAYNLKMKTGTWAIADKKLFYDCVPKQYLNGLQFNQSFLDKLNSYSEYAKTTENKLVNLAQTHLDLMTASNLSKVK
jgi:hypothetical protein